MARDVLESPVYRDAMQQVQTEILNKWQVEKDALTRDWLWTLMQSAKRLDKVLTETMQTGQMREKQIDLEQSRLERAGKLLRRSFGG